ncbi:MAG: ketoacyl-ACP synthase III, partial [Gemmatimonadetes bacterium]|nr:ketoacyl-ACP synthase III [Gemmatimonadota bacterium]
MEGRNDGALPVKLAGLGYHLPVGVVTSAELDARLGVEPGWTERVTGVRERRYASGETSVGMAAAACRRALERAGVAPGEVDAIVGASSIPQQAIPCTAALVQRELGAPDGGSACWDVNATCLGFLFALQSVAHLVAAGVYRRVLVFSSEIAAHSRDPAAPESAALFGDAAAAALVTRAAPGEASAFHAARFATYASGADLTRIVGGGTLHHPNDPATTPEMNLFRMEGPPVLRKTARLLGPFVDDFLARAGWKREEVDVVVPHQASRAGLELLSRV